MLKHSPESAAAGNATAKAVQSFVLAGFPEAAVAKLTTESMPTFMSADGGTAPRVSRISSLTSADQWDMQLHIAPMCTEANLNMSMSTLYVC